MGVQLGLLPVQQFGHTFRQLGHNKGQTQLTTPPFRAAFSLCLTPTAISGPPASSIY